MDPSERQRREIDEEALVRSLLEGAGPRPPLDEADVGAISGAARFVWKARERRSRRTRILWALAAGVGVIALGLALLRWRSEPAVPAPAVADVEAVSGVVAIAARPLAAGDAIPAGSLLESGGRGRASLRLGDGATVRLDEETRVRMVSAARLDLERGAVYLDTGGAAPIEVRTPAGTAHDVGTQFLVRFEPAAARLTVAVRAGAVEVNQSGRAHLAPAGEEIVLDGGGGATRRALPGHGGAWAWVVAAAPPFEIEGRTLGEFLDDLGRETGWRFRFTDETRAAGARAIVLHGGVPRAQRPDQILDAILAGAGFEGEIEDGIVVVRPSGNP